MTEDTKITGLKKILADIYPLHRTLASDGTDEALEIVAQNLPKPLNFSIHSYPSGSKVWTWTIPERFIVHEAYLETEDGERILDFNDNPLHLISYSIPMDKIVSWDELKDHLLVNEKRPWAIPWEFKYYEKDWGFCLSKQQLDVLSHDKSYRVKINTEFNKDPKKGFKVGAGLLGIDHNPSGELLISSHICHPMQANDDAAGVVTAIGLANRLAKNPLPSGSMSIRFWFGPETIGTIAYLANNELLIPNTRGAIFIEMTGNENTLAWHHTHQHDHLLDQISKYVFEKRALPNNERDFASAPANDERVINGPGVNIPCISVNRWPYDEYHTSDDNLSIIEESCLQEAADVIEEIVRIFASNYVPKRTFRGPVFLSGHGLWVDWRENWDLNRSIEKIMMRFEGTQSVFSIAQELGLDYWEIREYIERFREQGLIEALPIPREPFEN